MLVLLLQLVLSTLHFFAKIKDMNLEDLGSQFISNFHQSQNQIQPLYISVKVSIYFRKALFIIVVEFFLLHCQY